MKLRTPFIFLFSSERSGSNLLSSIIGNHSACSFSVPTHLFRLLYLQESKYRDNKKLLADTKAIFDVKLGFWENENVKIAGSSIADVLKNLYHQKSKVIVVKELYAYKYFKKLNKDFFNSKIIYLVRDPRDVFVSIKKLPNLQTDIREFARNWSEEQTRSLNIFEELNIDYLVIKYEELISDPSSTALKVCKYLNLNFEEGMLDYHMNQSSRNQSKQLMAWQNLDKPVMVSNTQNFYRFLSSSDVALIEEITGNQLAKFGYLKSKVEKFNKKPSKIESYIYSDQENCSRLKRTEVLSNIFSDSLDIKPNKQ